VAPQLVQAMDEHVVVEMKSDMQKSSAGSAEMPSRVHHGADQPLVYIIVISYNGVPSITTCLTSLLSTTHTRFKVMVIDNASSDGTPTVVQNEFPGVELTVCGRNLGYGDACNRGIKRALDAGADYVALFNQDVVVEPRWLSQLLEAAQTVPEAGILSPLQIVPGTNRIDPSVAETIGYERVEDVGRADDPKRRIIDTDWAIGAALLLTRRLLDTVGGFDPFYFMYGEETDLCNRARFHGFKIVTVTDAHVYHRSTFSECSFHPKIRRLYFRNQYVLFLKNPRDSFLKNLYGYVRCTFCQTTARAWRDPRIRVPGAASAFGFLVDLMITQMSIAVAMFRLARSQREERLGRWHL